MLICLPELLVWRLNPVCRFGFSSLVNHITRKSKIKRINGNKIISRFSRNNIKDQGKMLNNSQNSVIFRKDMPLVSYLQTFPQTIAGKKVQNLENQKKKNCNTH